MDTKVISARVVEQKDFEVKVLSDEVRQAIVQYVAARTHSFGGGKRGRPDSIIAAALENESPVFALGVPIADVVDHVFDALQIYLLPEGLPDQPSTTKRKKA